MVSVILSAKTLKTESYVLATTNRNMFLALLGFTAAASGQICELCINRIERAFELSRMGLPLQQVNQTMLAECGQLSFMMNLGCKTYVKRYIGEIYEQANTTDLTPLEICRQHRACPQDELM